MTTTNPLSPAAQAVLDAITTQWLADPDDMSFSSIMAGCAAAALRAATDQVVPDDPLAAPVWTERDEIRADLLAIAAELESIQ